MLSAINRIIFGAPAAEAAPSVESVAPTVSEPVEPEVTEQEEQFEVVDEDVCDGSPLAPPSAKFEDAMIMADEVIVAKEDPEPKTPSSKETTPGVETKTPESDVPTITLETPEKAVVELSPETSTVTPVSETEENSTTNDVVTAEESESTTPVMTMSMVDETVQEEDEGEAEKTEEEKAAEEAEKRRVREAELDEQLLRLGADKAHCDVAQMVYSRSFLHANRDMEKEFKRTTCPLTDEQLKNFGIDRGSAPQGRENKKDFVINPPWMRKGPAGGGGDKPRYAGRHSADNYSRPRGGGGGGGNPRKPPGPRPSIERNIDRQVTLHKSEKAWKAEKTTEGMAEDEVKMKAILKGVRSLMNKITPTSQADLTREFLNNKVSSNPSILPHVIDIIFDKAVEEQRFCPMYAEICKAQVEDELSRSTNKSSPFRDAILTRAENTFRKNKAEDDERDAKVNAIKEESDPRKKAELEIALAEFDAKFRRRKFGNITFIGQLFRQKLLSKRIIDFCLMALLRESSAETLTPEIEEAISCAVQLLESIGKAIDADAADRVNFDKFYQHLDQIKPKTSNRIRFMILNLIELRKCGWKPRKTTDTGPKKIDQIHNEIKQEQIQNQQAREQYDRRQGLGGGPLGGMGPPKKTYIGGRGSLDNRNRISDAERRKKAATSSVLATSTAVPKKNSLSALKEDNPKMLGGKKSAWTTGASGGSGADSEKPAPRAWNRAGTTSREGSTSRKHSTATTNANDERAQLVAAVRDIAAPVAPSRSISQTSLSPEIDEAKQSGALSAERLEEIETWERKLPNTIQSDIDEWMTENYQLEEASNNFIELANNAKKGNVPFRSLFKSLARSAAEKMKPSSKHLTKAGHILAHALQRDELKNHKEHALLGIADYCELVIKEDLLEDNMYIWKNLAEMIVNASQCEYSVFDGSRPSLNDFSAAYAAAAKDEMKPYELLSTVLRRMAEINFNRDQKESETMTSMTYFEMKDVVSQFNELDAALKKIESPIPGHENLYELLAGEH